MKIWISVPVYNRIEFTVKFLDSLRIQTYRDFYVVICDHGSTDGTSVRLAQDYPEVIVINADSSLWWTGATNRCIAYVLQHAADDDVILTINNDNVVPPDYLHNLLQAYQQFPQSIITSTVYDIKTGFLVEPGYRQNWYRGTALAIDFAKQHVPAHANIAEVTHASGRGTLFPLKVFQQLGLYDEKHLPHYAADYDFSFKAARAGYKIYASLDCQVFSHVDETGMVKVLHAFSWRSFVNYFFSIRSPANLQVRWWFGWNNCPKWYFPIYFSIDMLRVFGSYFKSFVKRSR